MLIGLNKLGLALGQVESEFPEVLELVGRIIKQREEGMDTESAMSKLTQYPC